VEELILRREVAPCGHVEEGGARLALEPELPTRGLPPPRLEESVEARMSDLLHGAEGRDPLRGIGTVDQTEIRECAPVTVVVRLLGEPVLDHGDLALLDGLDVREDRLTDEHVEDAVELLHPPSWPEEDGHPGFGQERVVEGPRMVPPCLDDHGASREGAGDVE